MCHVIGVSKELAQPHSQGPISFSQRGWSWPRSDDQVTFLVLFFC